MLPVATCLTDLLLAERAVVVAQLVERLLPTPEIHGSNPNIRKVLFTNCELNRRDDNNDKEARKGPSLKKLAENYVFHFFLFPLVVLIRVDLDPDSIEKSTVTQIREQTSSSSKTSSRSD